MPAPSNGTDSVELKKRQSAHLNPPPSGEPVGDMVSIPSKKGQAKYKIQITLSKKAKDRLFLLVDKTDVESASQVVRDALRVYDILVEEISENGSELFLKEGTSGNVVRLKVF